MHRGNRCGRMALLQSSRSAGPRANTALVFHRLAPNCNTIQCSVYLTSALLKIRSASALLPRGQFHYKNLRSLTPLEVVDPFF
jgi:hypothetical protein